MKTSASLLFLGVSALTSGCATIVTGSSQDVTLVSEPSGAAVVMDGANRGVTPLTLNLKRKETPTFVLISDGYQDETFSPGKGSNGWIWGNIALGGIIGLAVDLGTGAHQKFDQDLYTVRMRPGQVAPPLAAARGPATGLEAFLVERHAELLSDIASGSGATLQEFYSTAGIAHGTEAETTRTLSALYRLSSGPDDFRRMVMAEFAAPAPAPAARPSVPPAYGASVPQAADPAPRKSPGRMTR